MSENLGTLIERVLFSELPDADKDRAVKGLNRIWQGGEAYFHDAGSIGSAFTWSDTAEGIDFWQHIYLATEEVD